MKKFISLNKEFIIGFILTISLFWPLFSAPFFTHHDDVQVIRLFEMDKCFKDGQIPCRWVPDLGGLYGYPMFNYYAPLPYYFGEIFYALSGSLLFSVKVMFGASFLGSFIFMFLLARKFFGKLGGSLSAIFYTLAPYHAVDFYVRGAMGEMWGFMFYPAIFWAIVRLKEKVTLLNLLLSAIFIAGLITAHNLSAMIFLPLVLIFIILLFLNSRDYKFLWFSVCSFVLGILLSSFYLLPVSVEKNLVHVDTTISGYFSYTEHFKGFKKLFLERTWGWGASVREVPGGERDGLSFQIGWVHLLGWMLAIFTMVKLWNKNSKISKFILLSSIVIVFTIFMINPRSEFIWKLIEPLKYLQFPWRLLIIVTFFISLISGSIFMVFQKRKTLIWFLLVILVVLLNFSYFRPERFITVTQEELLTGKNWDKQIKRSIFDYLPIYAKEPPAELATERYKIIVGDTRIFDFKEGTNWISFKADTKEHTIIRLSQYYFPDWKIFVDGSPVNVEYKNNSLGLMTIILGKGMHNVSARLYDTPVRAIGNALTVFSLVLTILLFIFQLSPVKKWIKYYRKGMH